MPAFLLRALPLLIPAAVVLILLAQIALIVVSELPGHDESELLHASWLMAHGKVPWIDFFENHSPVYLWINAHLLAPDSVLYLLYAKLFHLAVYVLSAGLFLWAARLWLGIERAHLGPFCVLALIVYFALTWPAELGIVRPEGYAFAALFAGAVAGYFAGGSVPRLLLSGVGLGLAAGISLRTLPLVALIGTVMTLRAPDLRGKLNTAILVGTAAAFAIALNFFIAPLSGYYLWMVDFNGHFIPVRARQLPTASYPAIQIDLFAIVMDFGLLAGLIWAKQAGAAIKTGGWGRLLVAAAAIQVTLVLAWIFVWSDHAWGGQSFSGIVVASAFFLCILIAASLRAYKDGWPERFMIWALLALANAAPGLFAVRRHRPPFSRQAARLSRTHIWIGAALAAGLGAGALVFKGGSTAGGWMQTLYGWTEPYAASGGRALITDLGWPGWILYSCGAALLLLGLQWGSDLPDRRRARILALALRVRFVLLAGGIAGLLDLGARAAWPHLPGRVAQLHIWPPPDIVMALSFAAAIGLARPKWKAPAAIYALLIAAGHLLFALSSPSQIVVACFLGAIVVLGLRDYFSARRLGFGIDRDGRAVVLPIRLSREAFRFARRLEARDATEGRVALARSIAAAILLALTAWGLCGFLNAQFIRSELSRQVFKDNFRGFAEAWREDGYRIRSADDLAPLDQAANLGQWLLWSRRYCELLRGDTVMMRPTMHPVCANDGSFYWYGGEYMQTFKQRGFAFHPDPPYRMNADLERTKPALLDAIFVQISVDAHSLDPLLQRDYVPVKRRDGKIWLYIRKTWLLARTGAPLAD